MTSERDSSFYEHVMDLAGEQPGRADGWLSTLSAAIYLAVVELQRVDFCEEEVNQLLEEGRDPDIDS